MATFSVAAFAMKNSTILHNKHFIEKKDCHETKKSFAPNPTMPLLTKKQIDTFILKNPSQKPQTRVVSIFSLWLYLMIKMNKKKLHP